MRSYSAPTSKVDEENPYWVSFSDLMSGLLVIFILASVALIIQLTEARIEFEAEMTQKREELKKEQEAARKLQAEVTQLKEELRLAKLKIRKDIDELKNAERARIEILQEVRKKLALQNITVEIVDNDTVLRIPETTLTFSPNSYELPANANLRQAVAAIGAALHEAVLEPFSLSSTNAKRFEYLDTVFIEGHTDSRPTSRIKGNWGLSTFRSISLWEFWEELSVKPAFSEMENSKGQKLFSVSGYAASRRLQLEERTPDQRRANRRIDIRFTVKRPTIADLEEIVQP